MILILDFCKEKLGFLQVVEKMMVHVPGAKITVFEWKEDYTYGPHYHVYGLIRKEHIWYIP